MLVTLTRWTVQVENCGVEVLQLGIHNFPGAGFHLPSITALAEDVIHWWLCGDLPGVHNGPCHSLTTQVTLYFRSLHFTKSVVASQFCVQRKPRIQRCSNSFFGLKRRQKWWSLCNDSYDSWSTCQREIAGHVMLYCTVHEAQQAPYTWWAQLWVASSTVMANKSCSSLADASSLHLEAADVASYMRRERASFATRGKLWKLWTGVTFSGRNDDKIWLLYKTWLFLKKREKHSLQDDFWDAMSSPPGSYPWWQREFQAIHLAVI